MEKYLTIHENRNNLEQFWLKDLDLSVRALNSIKQARIQSKEDLLNLSESDLTLLKFGKKSIQEISKLCSKYSTEKFEYREEDYWIKQINSLNRYAASYNDSIDLSDDGEYIKLSDVLDLFSVER